MDEQLLTVFKLALLALLYLFFLRVMWAVWTELRSPRLSELARGGPARPGPSDPLHRATMAGPPNGPVVAKGADRRRRRRGSRRAPTRLEITEPAASAGRVFELRAEMTIGRAPGCQVHLDDTFASNLHARVFHRDAAWFLEDLASTNGTVHNAQRVSSTVPLARGDTITIGSTVLSVR